MAVKLMFVHALSALHAGAGQGVGVIDLPISRERATNLPVIPGSSIKGCMKDGSPNESREAIFGTKDSAGLLQVSDARLLLLPVRCMGATFVWATAPYVLRRFCRDLEASGIQEATKGIPELREGSAVVAGKDPLVTVQGKAKLVLEDLDFDATTGTDWAEWIGQRLFAGDKEWQAEFQKRFAIIDDKSFAYLAEFATEVTAHVRIGEEGTVEPGALWYQEALPAETVLVSLLRAEQRNGGMKEQAVLASAQSRKHLQLGGKATTGLGLVRLAFAGGPA